jgi:hypothetical protein
MKVLREAIKALEDKMLELEALAEEGKGDDDLVEKLDVLDTAIDNLYEVLDTIWRD